jgi:hypothetical protein
MAFGERTVPSDEKTSRLPVWIYSCNPFRCAKAVFRGQYMSVLPGLMTDILGLGILWLLFYNYYPGEGDYLATASTVQSVKGGRTVRHSYDYRQFDKVSLLVIGPLLFSVLFLSGFFIPPDTNSATVHPQPKDHPVATSSRLVPLVTVYRSWFVYLLTKAPLLSQGVILLGECSLPFYIFQQIFMLYYVLAVDSIVYDVNGFTRDYALHHVKLYIRRGNNIGWLWFGLILVALLSVFMQKIYQERFITYLHMKWMTYLRHGKQKKLTAVQPSAPIAIIGDR